MRRRVRPLGGLFVTGTDTGVGKTLVACAIARWCRQAGLDVGVMKPVATGGIRAPGHGRRWVSEDALALAEAAGVEDPPELINPVCFREPLAPWTAARRVGRRIRLTPLVRACDILRSRHAYVIVEGIGGLLVPVTPRQTVADLAAWLGLPLLVVARPGLGTLNHTLLTIEAIRARRLPLHGVVINVSRPPAATPVDRLAERTNPTILRRFVSVLGTLPFLPRVHARQETGLAQWLERALGARTLSALTGV